MTVKGATMNGQSGAEAPVPGDILKDYAVDHGSGTPVWIQLRNRISYLIGKGRLKEGDRLPTVRALAVALDISYNTANRAYMDLEREGYVVTRKGRGTFVANRRSVGANRGGDSALDLLIDEAIRQCIAEGLDDDDIMGLVSDRILFVRERQRGIGV